MKYYCRNVSYNGKLSCPACDPLKLVKSMQMNKIAI